MNAKMGREVDLIGIYTKERAENGKVPAQFSMKASTFWFASGRKA